MGHILMTLQQALSAYYFLTAFEPHPSLVGRGRPFCVLAGGNLLQLGAYLLAAALFVGGVTDVETQVNAPELQERDSAVVTELEDEDYRGESVVADDAEVQERPSSVKANSE